MTQPAPPVEPGPPDPPAPVFALCDDLPTAEQVQALFDAERGLPVLCVRADGAEPPPGVPRTLLHGCPIEPIGDGRFAHPLPGTELPPGLAGHVLPETAAAIAALKSAHQPPDPPGLDLVGETGSDSV